MEFLYLLVLVAACATWVAVAREDKRLERIFKPLTVVLLLGAVLLTWDGSYELRFWATVVALIFSLAGDVFLMQERDLLLQGLASFFFAHVAYIVAFGGPVLSPFSVFMVSTLILVSGSLFLLVRHGLRRREQEKLTLPVLAYVVVISAMVVTAYTAPGPAGWTDGGVFAAAIGASLFYASDALIGIQRFVRPTRWSPVAIMVTYHLAQVLLVTALNQPAGLA